MCHQLVAFSITFNWKRNCQTEKIVGDIEYFHVIRGITYDISKISLGFKSLIVPKCHQSQIYIPYVWKKCLEKIIISSCSLDSMNEVGMNIRIYLDFFI